MPKTLWWTLWDERLRVGRMINQDVLPGAWAGVATNTQILLHSIYHIYRLVPTINRWTATQTYLGADKSFNFPTLLGHNFLFSFGHEKLWKEIPFCLQSASKLLFGSKMGSHILQCFLLAYFHLILTMFITFSVISNCTINKQQILVDQLTLSAMANASNFCK